MKITILVFTLLISILPSLAMADYVDGAGYSTGFCQGGHSSYFCIDQLKYQAENEAVRDADLRCRMKRGNLLSYTKYCSTYCSHYSVPDNQNAYVNCNARCQFDCEIRE